MTDKELYEAWKKADIHNYEGTRSFATEHGVELSALNKIINTYRDLEITEPAPIPTVKVATNNGRVLSDDVRQQIKDGIEQGKSTKEIAKEVGCTRNTVLNYRKKLFPSTTNKEKEQKPADQMLAVIGKLTSIKDIIDAEATTKSIKAEADLSEASILFETEASSYIVTIKRTHKE